MAAMSTIQIFKPGKHTPMSGKALSFSEADLRASCEAYDPAKYEAPLVVGHPGHDKPAYGWVKSLSYAGGIEAEPHQVDAAFAEMVNKGRFKKISASFYTPDSPSNPVPGVYYLRHVGFLGALPPSVKGLRPVEFGENEEGVIDFADWDDVANASLWRRLRDWMISKEGLDAADSIIPDYQVSALETAAQQEDDDQGGESSAVGPSFSELKGKQVTPEEAKALQDQNTALAAENANLKKANADFAEASAKDKRDAAHSANVSFAEGLVKEGKLLPAAKDATVAILDYLAGQEVKVEFGEGDNKTSTTPLDAYKAQLHAAPKVVEFGEKGADKGGKGTVEFAAPAGYTVDPEGLELHQKVVAYQKQHNVTYDAALSAVSGQS